MNEFDKMYIHNPISPNVKTFFISDKNIVTENGFVYKGENGEKIHVHPEYDKFKWVNEPLSNLNKIKEELLSVTKVNYMSVIAVFEDHTIKTITNVDNNFIPSLDFKYQ